MGGVSGSAAGGILPAAAPPPTFPKPLKVQPLRVGGNVQETNVIRRVEPVYPEAAKRAHVSGMVVLEAKVDEQGNVSEARVIQGHPLLNEAAIQAVKQWKYSLTLLNGQAVPVIATATVVFQLGDKSKLDTPVAMLVARLKAGGLPEAGERQFVRDGKAEVDLTVAAGSDQLKARLRALSFEVISWPEAGNLVTGRIAVERLESLANIESVLFIAPHYRRDAKTPGL